MSRGPVRRCLGFAALALLLGAAPAFSIQPVSPTPNNELHVNRLDVSKYPNGAAVVVIPSELPTQAITEGSFTIYEGGEQRQATFELLPTTDDLAVVLIIDTSGSMAGAGIAGARQAAQSFVSAMPAQARIAVVGFGSTPKIYSAFTTDRAATVAALNSLKAQGATALYDAVTSGSKLFGDAAVAIGSRRVIVLLTDGGDSASKATLAEASRALQQSGATLSSIAMATIRTDTAALALLTSSVHGAMVPAADAGALQGVFHGVANSVLREYRIRWTSVTHGKVDLTVDLQVNGKHWRSVQPIEFPSAAAPASLTPTQRPVGEPRRRIILATSGRPWLYGGLATGFFAALCALMVILWPRPAKRRLAPELGVRTSSEISGLSKGLIRATRSYFARHGRGRRLSALLEQAGMAMDAPTAAVLAGGIGVCGMAIGLALGSALSAIILGFFAVAGCYVVVKSRADRRCELFQTQFDAALQIIINSLRSGYGVSQAIGTVAAEANAPVSDEFRRIVIETGLGMDQIRALEACARRTRCDELVWVAECMEVNRDVGGNLSEILVGIAETIRSRTRLARQVATASAEGRMSAKILIAMPFLALVFQLLFNRTSLAPLFHGKGLILTIGSCISMTIGYLWTKSLIKIRY